MTARTRVARSFDELLDALDGKEQRFVLEYVECLNATAAARVSHGIKDARRYGYKVLHRPDVKAAITAGLREQQDRTDNNADRVIRELMAVAYADPRQLVDDDGNPLPLRELPAAVARTVASIEFERETIAVGEKSTTRTRVLRYRLVPKTPAIELLGKRLKMFSDRLELDAGDSLAALVKAAFHHTPSA